MDTSGELVDVHKVVDYGIRLFDDNEASVGHTKTPEHHKAAPKGAAVSDLSCEAVVVRPKLLEAIGEEEDSFPDVADVLRD